MQVYLGVDPSTGKKRYHSEAVKGPWSKAGSRRAELVREVAAGSVPGPGLLTLGDYLESWLRDHAAVRVRQRTLEGYRATVPNHVLPRLGRVQLTAGNTQGMESALLREGGLRGQGLSPRTVFQVHRVLSSALRTAERLGLVSSNVARGVDPPRVERHEIRTLDWGDVHRLLGQIDNPLYRCLVLVDVQTGLRQSELLGLQWRDIDLAARALSVRRAWIKLPSGTMDLTAPKSGRERVLDLPAESVDALRAWRSGSDGNGDFVFCHSDGSPLDPDAVTQGFKRMATRAGLGYLRFHDLRHTHASLMLSQGVHLKIVSERLGHSSIAVTGDLYSHVLPTVQREAVERFGVAWSASVSNQCQIESDAERFP